MPHLVYRIFYIFKMYKLVTETTLLKQIISNQISNKSIQVITNLYRPQDHKYSLDVDERAIDSD